MVKSRNGEEEAQVVFELDADGHLREAVKALQEAAWHLHMASYTLEEWQARLSPSVRHAMETGACVAVAELLATQVEAVGTQTRRLRKRAREF